MDEKKLTLARRVIAALRGDQDSYKVLFQEAAPEVWEICKRYFLNDDDAKSAFDTTFETVAETFADQKDPTDYLSWAKRIANLACADKVAALGGLADAEVKDLNLLTVSEYEAVLPERWQDSCRKRDQELGSRRLRLHEVCRLSHELLRPSPS